MLTYAYTHSQTQATTGYFSCEPTPPLPLDAALAFLCEHPLDDFMRRHLLLRMGSLPGGAVLAAFGPWEHNLPAPLQALAQELALVAPPLAEVLAPLMAAPLAHDAINTATSPRPTTCVQVPGPVIGEGLGASTRRMRPAFPFASVMASLPPWP